jgi:hypothetical protein
MAFIPDDVMPLMRERKLSPNARLVYEAHCKFRRHKYRVSFATTEEVAEYLGLPIGSVRNAVTELKAKGWIRQVTHYTEMLVGDFSEVDKNHPRREIPAGPLFRRPVRAASQPVHETMISNHETVNGNHGSVNEIHETMISNHETVNGNHGSVNLHIKERARDSSHSSQASHTHTATPAARARDGDAEDASPVKVCVCGLDVTLEMLERYARNHPKLKEPDGFVNAAWERCVGHALIKRWLERERTPAEASKLLNPKDCPDCGGTGMHYPEGYAKGVAKCPHAGLYAQLHATAEARAHAPP